MFGSLALGRIVHEEDENDTNDCLRGDGNKIILFS